MTRLLIIPAAGLGSRLGGDVPKALVPINGRPMIEHVASLYEPYVAYTVVIAHPSFAARMEAWADEAGCAEVAVQQAATGMLDAIVLAASAVSRLRPTSVWITWCDQVGVLPATIERLAREEAAAPQPALTLPTVRCADPYTHIQRDADGRIIGTLNRREGDQMPAEGEADMGLFALTRDTFEGDLLEYSRHPAVGAQTGERLFLPFVSWVAGRRPVATFPCTDPMEAVGVNTPEQLRLMEAWLRERRR
jgi:bifunctional N-acetylglucosamine-1-phosphate-uridyltransferase/glucosamine-1-phosphate-acetyltransferase GlmU-like protein